MNELSCGVARDLLPLYADNLIGEESRVLIEAHLESCEACRTELGTLRMSLPKEAPKAEKSLRRVKGKLKKRLITAVSVTLVVAIVLYGGWFYIDSYMPPMEYREGLIGIDDFGGQPPELGFLQPYMGCKVDEYHRVDEEGKRWLWYFVHLTEPSLYTRLYFKFHTLSERAEGAYSWLPLGLRDDYGRPIKHAQHIGVYYVYDWKAFQEIMNYAPVMGNDRLLDRKTGQLTQEALALCKLIWEGVVEGE